MEMAVESIEMAPRPIPHPGRVPEQTLLSPELRLQWWRRCGTLSGKTPKILGFLRRRLYIGRGAMSEGTRGPTVVVVNEHMPQGGLSWGRLYTGGSRGGKTR
jgi:hypothetical protein